MGSATYPVLGVKLPDYRSNTGGELMYVRGGAAALGDVKMVSLHPSAPVAEVAATKIRGTSDSALANVEPAVAGTANVNFIFGFFRVCTETAGVVDDGRGHFAGEQRCIVKCKVTHAGGTLIQGTPLVPVTTEVHLAEIVVGSPVRTKVVAIVAETVTMSAGVNVIDVIFDGDNGFGQN